MAQQEPAGIVRRRLVAQLAAEGPEGIKAALEANLDQASLSVAVERAGPTIVGNPLLPGRLRILAEICNERELEERWPIASSPF